MKDVLKFSRTETGFIHVGKVTFSPGCRYVTFENGRHFVFNEKQALFVNCMVEHGEYGILYVHSSVLRERLQLGKDLKAVEGVDADTIQSQLKDFFKKHPAWGTFIKNTGPGRGAKIYLDFDFLPEENSPTDLSEKEFR